MTYDPSYVRGKSAIVGVADRVSPTGVLGIPDRVLEMQMIKEALDDAGLDISDVDGLCATGMMMPSMELAEHLGITPRWTNTTMTGGSSFEVHVQQAAAAIACGMAEVVVSVYAATPRAKGKGLGDMSQMMGMMDSKNPMPMVEWELPYANVMPAGAYALAASRHQAIYGTTSEQLAQIAVSTREWAGMNERARYRDPLTIQDVIDSPMVSTPLHRLDCCLVTDGAGAFVMTSAERAKDLKKKPVYVLGGGTAHDHAMMISQMPDITTTPGVISGRDAFKMAGIKPSDVDVLESYDSFTITVALSLEDLGFCEKGEAGAFVEDGKIGPGGSLPVNTNGGGLSFCHPGMYGMFLIVEAVRQVRGECDARQVPNANIAVAHGMGGVLSCASTVVLGSEDTL
ncbi:MAG: thiolase [Moraxellaceae bacterium]|nr:MAG: thiolase [Moraxellaceae bacterium]